MTPQMLRLGSCLCDVRCLDCQSQYQRTRRNETFDRYARRMTHNVTSQSGRGSGNKVPLLDMVPPQYCSLNHVSVFDLVQELTVSQTQQSSISAVDSRSTVISQPTCSQPLARQTLRRMYASSSAVTNSGTLSRASVPGQRWVWLSARFASRWRSGHTSKPLEAHFGL